MDTVVRSRRWRLGRGVHALAGSALAGMAALGIDLRPAQARAWSLRIAEARQYPSVCPYCAVGCDTMVYAQDGVILDIEGDPNSPINQGALCPKGAAIYQFHVNRPRPHRESGGSGVPVSFTGGSRIRQPVKRSASSDPLVASPAL